MRPASRCFGVYVALLIVLSPAKRLDFTAPALDVPSTPRRCADETAELAKVTRKLSRAELRRLMSISDALADLNYERFQAFDNETTEGALQAVFAFAGDVYDGLDAPARSPPPIWPGPRITCASSRASTVCCARWTPSSPIGWRWARD